MSPTEAPHGAGGRLGDVIRVVGALERLGAEERELVARLLPAPERADRGAWSPPAGPRAAALSAPRDPVAEPRYERAADEPQPVAARLAAAARRSARSWLAAARSLTPRLAGVRRRWIALAVGVAAIVVALAGFDLLPFWLTAPLLAVAVVAGLALGGQQLVAWRRSPLLRSSARSEAAAPQDAAAVAGPPATLATARYEPPPRAEPIVAPLRGRALALGLAGVSVAGPLDLRRLVEDIAGGRTRRTPPRLERRSLRRGVQLLVDRGPALDPLRDDVVALAGWLRQVASPAGLELLGFRGDPRLVTGVLRPGVDPDEPLDYRGALPRAGSAVVVVCDLGIGRPRTGPAPAPPAVWQALDRLVRQVGFRALYLVPYPPERWPAALAGRLAIVQWREELRLDELVAPRARGRARVRS